MKTLSIVGAILACSATLLAEAPAMEWALLKVANGKEYSGAKLMAVEADGIKVQHAAGIARIPYEHLPYELRQQLKFDPTKAKVARAERLDAQCVKAAQVPMRHVDYGKIDFEIVNVKIVRVLPEGLLCYRYQPGGAAGETARTVNAMVDNPRRFRGPEQQTTVEATPPSQLWLLQGVKDKAAEGDVLVGIAGRHGTIELEGRTLARWIAKP